MKKIKVLILVVSICFLNSYLGYSQSYFDKFEDNPDIASVIVSGKMFQMFSKIQTNDKDSQPFMEMAKHLTGMKVFTTEKASVAELMRKDVQTYLKTAQLQELARVKDKDANIKFYVKEGKSEDIVSELLMFVDGASQLTEGASETILLTLTGDIDLNKISVLADKMNLPSAVKKVGKNQ